MSIARETNIPGKDTLSSDTSADLRSRVAAHPTCARLRSVSIPIGHPYPVELSTGKRTGRGRISRMHSCRRLLLAKPCLARILPVPTLRSRNTRNTRNSAGQGLVLCDGCCCGCRNGGTTRNRYRHTFTWFDLGCCGCCGSCGP